MTYTGSTKSKKYHTPDCRWGKVIPDDYAVHFGDREAVEAAGFFPCAHCCSNFRDIKDAKIKKMVCQKIGIT